jgi:hypothetical protein
LLLLLCCPLCGFLLLPLAVYQLLAVGMQCNLHRLLHRTADVLLLLTSRPTQELTCSHTSP